MKNNKIELFYSRFSFSGNREDGSDGVNLVRVDNSKYIERYKVGGEFVSFVAAPGSGRLVWSIARIDEKGMWGYLVEDTSRI